MGGDSRVYLIVLLKDVHPRGVYKFGGVFYVAGDGRIVRVGDVDDLEGVGVDGRDHSVGVVVPVKDVHASCACKLVGVGYVAGGGRIVRVCNVDYLEGGIKPRRDRRVGAVVPVKDGHTVGAVKFGVARIVVDAAGGGRLVRVGYIDDLEGVVVYCRNRRVGLVVPVKDGHGGGAVKLGVARIVVDAAGGGRLVRVGYVHNLDAVLLD